MLRYLAFPLIAAAGAVAVAFLPYLVAIPFVDEPQPVEAALAGAAIFFFILALANHVAATRLGARLNARLAGLDDFDADLRRRIGRLEATLARLALEERPRPAEPRTPAEGNSPAPGEATGDAKVIPFDPEARQRPARAPAARPAGARLAEALDSDAIQAWFQPVVTLPGRKTRFLEAVPYLAAEGGAAGRRIEPGYANDPEIDRRMLVQSLTLLRELDRAERALGVIWPVHAPLLADRAAFGAVERILETNSVFARQLIARIDHRDHAGLDAGQRDRLHRLRELGFTLALGNSPLPPGDSAVVASGLFGILFVDAARLVAGSLAAGAGRPALVPTGAEVEIIACGVTAEEQAMTLIDLDVLLAQGEFFSPPRPRRRPGAAAQAAET